MMEKQLEDGRHRLAAARRIVAQIVGLPLADVWICLVPPRDGGGGLREAGYFGARATVDGIEYAFLVKCRQVPSDEEAMRRAGEGLAARIAAKAPMSFDECMRITHGEPTE